MADGDELVLVFVCAHAEVSGSGESDCEFLEARGPWRVSNESLESVYEGNTTSSQAYTSAEEANSGGYLHFQQYTLKYKLDSPQN